MWDWSIELSRRARSPSPLGSRVRQARARGRHSALAATIVVFAFVARALVSNFQHYLCPSSTDPFRGRLRHRCRARARASRPARCWGRSWTGGAAATTPFGFVLVTVGDFDVVLLRGDGRGHGRVRHRAGLALRKHPPAGLGPCSAARTAVGVFGPSRIPGSWSAPS